MSKRIFELNRKKLSLRKVLRLCVLENISISNDSFRNSYEGPKKSTSEIPTFCYEPLNLTKTDEATYTV